MCAAMQAGESRGEGDMDELTIWKRVIIAIEKLQDRGLPGEDETVH